jgi:hypothetical protein
MRRAALAPLLAAAALASGCDPARGSDDRRHGRNELVGRGHRAPGRARSPSNERRREMIESRPARIAIAVAAGLALADASVVVLALPPILAELDASVETVAAVIGVYTLALALAAYAVTRWRGRPGAIVSTRARLLRAGNLA